MSGTAVFARKEAMEILRTWRIWVLPGILLFWWMIRTGLVDAAMGTAGEVGEGDARS